MINHSSTDYANTKPFPHCLLIDAFPDDLLKNTKNEIVASVGKNNVWDEKNNPTSKKFGCSEVSKLGKNVEQICNLLASTEFIASLEKLTSISNLESDPTSKGAGVHLIGNGGFLKIHADFNYHQQLKKYRRVNLLLYLNDDWKPEYGGNLELWDKDIKQCVHSYPPLFNHCVIFTSTDHSYHGHPKPLTCPENIYRKSIAAYYYSVNKPDDTTKEYHSTLYKET